MAISSTSGCCGYSDPALLEVRRQIAVLEKTADVQESQAQALVELVQQAVLERPGVGTRINVLV